MEGETTPKQAFILKKEKKTKSGQYQDITKGLSVRKETEAAIASFGETAK